MKWYLWQSVARSSLLLLAMYWTGQTSGCRTNDNGNIGKGEAWGGTILLIPGDCLSSSNGRELASDLASNLSWSASPATQWLGKIHWILGVTIKDQPSQLARFPGEDTARGSGEGTLDPSAQKMAWPRCTWWLAEESSESQSQRRSVPWTSSENLIRMDPSGPPITETHAFPMTFYIYRCSYQLHTFLIKIWYKIISSWFSHWYFDLRTPLKKF